MPPVLTNQSTVQNVQAMMNSTLVSMGQPPVNVSPAFGQDTDLRSVDPRLGRSQNIVPPQMAQTSMDLDMRMIPPNQMDYGGQRNMQQSVSVNQRPFPTDPRQRSGGDPRDPRQNKNVQQQQQQQTTSLAAQLHRGISNDASDQEKAALIMQVLKLTDEQIAILPPEQRASILVLKEQIAKSASLK